MIASQYNGALELHRRKTLACHAFWSDQAINIEFRTVRGDRPFTLKEFVAFVVSMPNHQLEKLRGTE